MDGHTQSMKRWEKRKCYCTIKCKWLGWGGEGGSRGPCHEVPAIPSNPCAFCSVTRLRPFGKSRCTIVLRSYRYLSTYPRFPPRPPRPICHTSSTPHPSPHHQLVPSMSCRDSHSHVSPFSSRVRLRACRARPGQRGNSCSPSPVVLAGTEVSHGARLFETSLHHEGNLCASTYIVLCKPWYPTPDRPRWSRRLCCPSSAKMCRSSILGKSGNFVSAPGSLVLPVLQSCYSSGARTGCQRHDTAWIAFRAYTSSRDVAPMGKASKLIIRSSNLPFTRVLSAAQPALCLISTPPGRPLASSPTPPPPLDRTRHVNGPIQRDRCDDALYLDLVAKIAHW